MEVQLLGVVYDTRPRISSKKKVRSERVPFLGGLPQTCFCSCHLEEVQGGYNVGRMRGLGRKGKKFEERRLGATL